MSQPTTKPDPRNGASGSVAPAERHIAAIEAVLTRQRQLATPTVELIYRETGTYPRVDEQVHRSGEQAKASRCTWQACCTR